MIRVFVDLESPKLDGRVLYHADEYSFDFKPDSITDLDKRVGSAGRTSIVIGTLQIEIDVETGAALYVWGYHPHLGWRSERLSTIASRPGTISVLTKEQLHDSVSVSLAHVNEWTTVYDPTTGWICVGASQVTKTVEFVEFATKTVAGIEKGVLRSIWLRPEKTLGLEASLPRHWWWKRSRP